MAKERLMFTGIITNIGQIESIQTLKKGRRLRILTNQVDHVRLGSSISCNGICLTVTNKSTAGLTKSWFEVEAWSETLHCTTLESWTSGIEVNLEPALKLGDELGGHLVSGHIDGLVKTRDVSKEGSAVRVYLEAPENLAPFISKKGSIALDGVSLTVNSVDQNIFDVLLIEYTLKVTTLKNLKPGVLLNLEVDQVARILARLLEYRNYR